MTVPTITISLAIGAKTARQAKDYETDFLRQYQDVQLSKRACTFAEAVEDFLDTEKGLKSSSLRTKTGVLKIVTAELGSKKVNLITCDTLRKLINVLETKYSRNYVSKIYYAVNEVFEYCVTEGRIQVNPLNRVKLSLDKDEIKKEMLFWETEQFGAFISEVDEQEFRVFFLVLYYMGLRKGEAQALQWRDIDLQSSTMHISKTFTSAPKG